MEIIKVFQEIGKLGNRIERLHQEMAHINQRFMEIMNECSHDLVIFIKDTVPTNLPKDGIFLCPACAMMKERILTETLEANEFTYSRIIPLIDVKPENPAKLYQWIREEIYQNIEFYYNQKLPLEELETKLKTAIQERKKEEKRKVFEKK